MFEFASISNAKRCDWGLMLIPNEGWYEIDKDDRPSRKIPPNHAILIRSEFVSGQAMLAAYDIPTMSEVVQARAAAAQSETDLEARNLESERQSAIEELESTNARVKRE